jgi:hypothetical protein
MGYYLAMLTTSEHLSPVAVSQIMINFAANHGVDRDTCLLGTGITECDLVEGEALITRAQEMRLIENLMLALPDIPALGFKLGFQYSVSTFGIWGFALRTCRTLREATDLAMRYLPLSTAYCRIECFDEPERFGISLEPESIPLHLRQFLLERDMATGINLNSMWYPSVTSDTRQDEPESESSLPSLGRLWTEFLVL